MRVLSKRAGHPFGASLIAAAALVLLMARPASGAGINESVNGDLSNDPLNPSNIGALALGGNEITGSTIPSGAVVDPMTGARAIQDNDYVTFTVPNGDVLSQIVLGGNSAFAAGDRMFFGIAQGAQVQVDPSFTSANGLLGWTLVDTAMIGSDLLPALGASAPANFPAIPGATGFTGPLGAGVYTLWMLDGDQPAAYALDLVAAPAPVPEPSTWMMLLAGLGLLGAIYPGATRRRRGAG